MPKAEHVTEEGFGFFRGTWLIKDMPVGEARQVAEAERRIAEVVGELSSTAEDFERLARVVEHDAESAEDAVALLSPAERAALSPLMGEEDEPSPLDGLELGVAGLVLALVTVRIMPAASCRGHSGDRAWSTTPVVLFAATEYRARALQPFVVATDCRFDVESARPDLLAVEGRSIVDTMALAAAVLANRENFVQHRPPRTPVRRRRSDQASLF